MDCLKQLDDELTSPWTIQNLQTAIKTKINSLNPNTDENYRSLENCSYAYALTDCVKLFETIKSLESVEIHTIPSNDDYKKFPVQRVSYWYNSFLIQTTGMA